MADIEALRAKLQEASDERLNRIDRVMRKRGDHAMGRTSDGSILGDGKHDRKSFLNALDIRVEVDREFTRRYGYFVEDPF